MRKFCFFIVAIWIGLGVLAGQSQPTCTLDNGLVVFTSDAPLELIEARSDKLRGLLNAEEQTFAFSITISTFKGFNSPLQQVHFYENYLEIDKFPTATFLGKIIEKVDLNQEGEYTIRAKGNLTIHGVKRERIIKVSLSVTEGVVRITSNFTILLEEHDIAIPRIVYQKIAEEIKVDLTGEMKINRQ